MEIKELIVGLAQSLWRSCILAKISSDDGPVFDRQGGWARPNVDQKIALGPTVEADDEEQGLYPKNPLGRKVMAIWLGGGHL